MVFFIQVKKEADIFLAVFAATRWVNLHLPFFRVTAFVREPGWCDGLACLGRPETEMFNDPLKLSFSGMANCALGQCLHFLLYNLLVWFGAHLKQSNNFVLEKKSQIAIMRIKNKPYRLFRMADSELLGLLEKTKWSCREQMESLNKRNLMKYFVK